MQKTSKSDTKPIMAPVHTEIKDIMGFFFIFSCIYHHGSYNAI